MAKCTTIDEELRAVVPQSIEAQCWFCSRCLAETGKRLTVDGERVCVECASQHEKGEG